MESREAAVISADRTPYLVKHRSIIIQHEDTGSIVDQDT